MAATVSDPNKSRPAYALWGALVLILLAIGFGSYHFVRGSDGDNGQAAGPASATASADAGSGAGSAADGDSAAGAGAAAIEPVGAFVYGPSAPLNSSADILNVHRRMADDPFAMGPVDAPVVISEFSDFECPFCSLFANDTLPSILKTYVDQGLVRVEWNDLPVNGPDAIAAAQAARAAAAQGKFAEFSEVLFHHSKNVKGHPGNKLDDFVAFAKEAGVPDLNRFEKEASDGTYAEVVNQARAYASGIGLRATPSFVIGDEFVAGAQPLENFYQIIDAQLIKAGATPPAH